MKLRQRHSHRSRSLLIGLLIAVLPLETQPARAASSDLERVTIGAPQFNNENTLPIQLGIKAGIYRAEGIEAQFVLIRGFTIVVALINGDLDYGIYGGTTIRAIASGMPIKVVMSNRSTSGLSLVARPGIHSVKDLRGKIVAIATVGDAMDYASRAILKHHGMDPDQDVKLRAVGPGQMTYQTLRSGMTDAGIMSVLNGTQLMREKKGFTILMEVDEVRKGVSNNLIVSGKKLKEQPAQVRKVIRATLRSIDYVRKNREKAVDYMVREWNIERDLAFPFYDRIISGYIPDSKSPDANFLAEVRDAQERGLLAQNIKVSVPQMRDYALLDEALKELGMK
jgi:ABC-type nitrate/sulfonate/bicarbonate transport system substrate-binding protein